MLFAKSKVPPVAALYQSTCIPVGGVAEMVKVPVKHRLAFTAVESAGTILMVTLVVATTAAQPPDAAIVYETV